MGVPDRSRGLTTRPDSFARTTHGARPSGGVRPYTGRTTRAARPPHRSTDHRYARPSYRHVRAYRTARYGVPRTYHYRGYYTRWYVHPWYRYQYSTTVVVGFGFPCYAWTATWAPPARAGWSWVPGYWHSAFWVPGYWAPVAPAPVNYAYVPGYWEGEAYVEGYYRRSARDGWEWTDGYYLDDGTYIRGHWVPAGDGPEGYTWEPGFYDGESWVDGFWRPEFRQGYTWVSSYFDDDAVFHSGYWLPTEQQPGQTWIPGWFDGNEWTPGYWVSDQEFGQSIDDWQPEEGWDDGWEAGSGWGDGDVLKNLTNENVEDDEVLYEDLPLAMPVILPGEAVDEDSGTPG